MRTNAKALAAILMLAVAFAQRAKAQQPIAPATRPQVTRRMVINIPAMSLELFENNDRVKSYTIAVGKRSTPTPVGTFRVAKQAKNPTWYGPGGQVVKAGRANPVGTRWIGLDRKGYGIHGTNAPRSIGRAASHGCIRMRNPDIEELFALVRVGDEVTILYETAASDGTTLRDVYGPGVATQPPIPAPAVIASAL